MMFLRRGRTLLGPHARAAVRRCEPLGFLPSENAFYRTASFQEKESPPPGALASAAPQAQGGPALQSS